MILQKVNKHEDGKRGKKDSVIVFISDKHRIDPSNTNSLCFSESSWNVVLGSTSTGACASPGEMCVTALYPTPTHILYSLHFRLFLAVSSVPHHHPHHPSTHTFEWNGEEVEIERKGKTETDREKGGVNRFSRYQRPNPGSLQLVVTVISEAHAR